MKLKYKYIIAAAVAGFALRSIGAVLKITHAPGADRVLLAATAVIVAALLLLIVKLVTDKQNKFLNR